MTTKFAGTDTRGFAAVDEPNVAVCLLPGTELAFKEEAEREHPFARLMPNFRFGNLGHNLARFRQVNADLRNTHHDALEFANGEIALLTQLCPGQHATVLQLPAATQATLQSEERRQPAPAR